MTPRQKALELYTRYYQSFDRLGSAVTRIQAKAAKQAALIAVDTVLAIKQEIWDDMHREYFEHWQQVKEEIERL